MTLRDFVRGNNQIGEESRYFMSKEVNANLYHVTKIPLYLSFTAH